MSGETSFLARIAARAAAHLDEADEFVDRLAAHGAVAIEHLATLYGDRDDFGTWVRDVFDVAIEAHEERSPVLLQRDEARAADPRWYLRKEMVGAWCYVDKFSGSLPGLVEHIDHLEDLSITYLHLMPVYARPLGSNDGGYAVTDYRRIHPPLGTMDDLRSLAELLHDRGISLALDFVFNHTADDHPWALGAKEGDPNDLSCYLTFATREETGAYEPWLRSIFPDQKPGSFMWEPSLQRWVWSTFHNYQWDLDYRNPEVFRRMLGEMLFLANVGVDIVRLDAVPFIWKEPGTNCEGLPKAHTVIRALNAMVRIAAPAMVFKSEAIVHPDEVRRYLGDATRSGHEAELAYNAALMVELWEALATGYTHLLRRSILERFSIPPATAWVNYVRSHDDIGWGFADEDAATESIDARSHRDYLNRFYSGNVAGSWARGFPFQRDPHTGDVRLCGTTASLAGLEQAMLDNDETAIDLAVARILLIYGIIIATPGSPLLTLGDELGTLNDYSYVYQPELRGDARWIHRPTFDWQRAVRRHDPRTVEGRIYGAIAAMLEVRTTINDFAASSSYRPRDVGNDHLHVADVGADTIVVGNFTADHQVVHIGEGTYCNALTGEDEEMPLTLEPYGLRWLRSPRNDE